MKKLFILTIVCLLAVTTQAQHTMLVNVKSAGTQQFETLQVDSVVCDSAIINGIKQPVVLIYRNGLTTPDQYPTQDVRDITWMVNETPEAPIEKNGVTLVNPEEFTMNEETMDVKGENCTVTLFPTAVEEDTKLVIRESETPQAITIVNEESEGGIQTISTDAKVIDVDLEGIHELDGAAKICIPFDVADGELPGAAYYNEETKEWEPVNSYYDREKGEVVILTSHFSMFSTFTVKKEMTKDASLEFFIMPLEDATPRTEAQVLIDAAVGVETWLSDTYEKMPVLEKDMCFNLVRTAGFDSPFMERLDDFFGDVATCFTAFDLCRYAYLGDNKKLGETMINFVASYLSDAAASNLLTSSVSSAVGFSTAFISYALNKFYKEAITGRSKIYRDAFNAYYWNKRGIGDLKSNYRTSKDWYQLFYPIFTKPNQTKEKIEAAVSALVNKYCWEFWEDENRVSQYFHEVSGLPWSTLGGLSQDIKDELSNELYGDLMGAKLVPVFEAISTKIYDQQYNLVKKELVKYAHEMNRYVVLQFKDGNITGEKSIYAGCKVRFRNMKDTNLKDKSDWECTLDDNGMGRLRFRLYPYVAAGVKPYMEIVNAENKVVKELTITISPTLGITTIDLNESNQKGFVKKEITTDKVSYTYTSYEHPIYADPAHDYHPYVWIYTVEDEEQVPVTAFPIEMEIVDKSIREIFERYSNFEYNPNGTFKVDNDELQLDGHFTLEHMQQRPQKGSGTFAINYANHLNTKTQSEVSQWWQNPNNSSFLDRFIDFLNPFLSGKMEQQITGSFTFEWNNDKQAYVFHFAGNGPYQYTGTVYNIVAGVTNGYYVPNPGAQCTGVEDVVIKGQATMDFEILYDLKE